jgi:hypothetical protein
VPVRDGQSYLYWIGGYWPQADGYRGKEPFFVGHRWALHLLQPLSGIFTIVSVNEKVYQEPLLTGR